MKEVRVFKVVQYWVDVEIEDHETEEDALDKAMNIDECDWDSEVTDSGILELED